LSDQFMNLGYHIYIMSTQSSDVEKTMPIQFATTLVLLILTLSLNLVAVLIRSRIRRRAKE
jgi:phosphate transport system permease protein